LKELISFIRDHLFYFSKRSMLIPLIVFLGLSISLYYNFDIGSSTHQFSKNVLAYFGIYFLIYSFGYYTTLFWYGYIYKNPLILSGKVLIISILLLVILAVDKAFPFHKYLSEAIISYPFVHYFNRIFRLVSLPVMLGVVVIILIYINNLNKNSLGLTVKGLKLMPFIYILTGLIPIVILASYNQGFQDYYPMYKPTLASEITDIPNYIFVGFYEFIYGMNLLTTELIFRGILVIGFIRMTGKGSIFPMVTLYCFIHFDKPIYECISSIFGGYVLGVIALYTRSIIGGSILHIGMAWLMELMAWIQHLYD